MTVVNSVKKTLANNISLTFSLVPALKDLKSINFSQTLSTNISGVIGITYNYDGNGTLTA